MELMNIYMLSFSPFITQVVFIFSREGFHAGESPKLIVEIDESVPIVATTNTKKYTQGTESDDNYL